MNKILKTVFKWMPIIAATALAFADALASKANDDRLEELEERVKELESENE